MGAGDIFGDLVEKGKETVQQGLDIVDDGVEICKLAPEFLTIYEVNGYFEEKHDELSAIGISDLLADADRINEISALIVDSNLKLREATTAAQKISRSNLRFSPEYLQSALDQLTRTLDSFNSITVRVGGWVIDAISGNGLTGSAGRFVLGSKKVEALTNLKTNLGQTASQVVALRAALTTLVDPSIRGQKCNNRILEIYLGAAEGVETFRKIYEAIQQVERAKEKLGL